MYALSCHRLGSLPRYASIRTCRRIAGRRFPPTSRAFRPGFSAKAPKPPSEDPANVTEPAWNHVQNSSESSVAEVRETQEEVVEDAETTNAKPLESEEVEGGDSPAERVLRLRDKSNYGSAARRAGRNLRKVRDVPRYVIPGWFVDRNILPLRDLQKDQGPKLHMVKSTDSTSSTISENALETENAKAASLIEKVPPDVLDNQLNESAQYGVYEIDGSIMTELSAMVAGVLPPPTNRYADSFPASKPHILLQSPKDGGVLFLDTVVKALAVRQAADLITIGAQDIAEIGGEQLGEQADCSFNSLRSLGYETHYMMGKHELEELEETVNEADETEDLFDEQEPQFRGKQSSHTQPAKFTSAPVVTYIANISDIFKSSKVLNTLLPGSTSGPASSGKSITSVQSREQSEDTGPSLLVETMIEEAQAQCKAARAKALIDPMTPQGGATIDNSPVTSETIQNKGPHDLIIMVRNYSEMNATRMGGRFLKILHEVVRTRRKEGQPILIIGTTSNVDLLPSISKAGFKSVQNELSFGPMRTVITPCRSPSSDTLFASDEKFRVKQINTRHIQDMIRRLAQDQYQVELVTVVNRDLQLDSAQVFASGLDEYVFSFEQVHRIATITLGLRGNDYEALTEEHLNRALSIVHSSDSAKVKWITEEKDEAARIAGTEEPDPKKQTNDRIRKLRKTCNAHEKKLLNGVVNPENIHTTFDDVRVPLETIEALKTLTSLSLVRPEAFTYGVLATDKIPGLLLYGPPGTGKTMLAKAVAKESGATVLEVSGSDVYDMYVGEGEKNIKAIFTLAKKLTPCVVFIDEADAIFGSRGTSSNRTSHRELINQFLREWDGMNDLSAFIMVATNRPFDLDDAVLRRLPRRLLVDLPKEKDREEILKIHLKDEILDPSISLATLASQTPFYSGSDLKNLSVAAALACVREENEAAKTHTGPEPYVYAKKRTLMVRHFEKATGEISASINEDMSSLGAIRKFDERFGDRRGRRKKSSGYGFGTVTEGEKGKEESVRVRT
ncbi:MAG: hypothetical protein MMC33_000070 [Icmadophila ericetorum]|nr:hypothetical protein [Icmadophila ericetorum]